MHAPPLYDFTAPAACRHSVAGGGSAPYVDASRVPCALCRDGHHRSRAAGRAGRQRAPRIRPPGRASTSGFLAVLFPAGISGSAVQPPDRRPRRQTSVRAGEAREDPSAVPAGTRCRLAPELLRLLDAAGACSSWPSTRSRRDAAPLARRRPPAGADPRARARATRSPDGHADRLRRGLGDRRVEPADGRGARRSRCTRRTVEQLMARLGRGDVMPPKSTCSSRSSSGLFVHPIDHQAPEAGRG